MQIRTITAGAREADIERVAQVAALARERLEAAGYVVQSLRLALAAERLDRCADFDIVAQGAEQQALEAGFDCVAIGRWISSGLGSSPMASLPRKRCSRRRGLPGATASPTTRAIRAAAQAIIAIGAATEHGFGNMRFAALAGVAPGSPFFPAAYHHGDRPWIAVGPEAAALAVEATKDQGPMTSDETDPAFVLRPSSFVLAALARLTTLIEQHDLK